MKEVLQANEGQRSIPGRRNSMFKDTEVGASKMCIEGICNHMVLCGVGEQEGWRWGVRGMALRQKPD